jgi:hypothetical protein
MHACFYCSNTEDLRPYGPKGAMVCFSCAMATPERENEATLQFGLQLKHSGPHVALDGTSVGPYPAEHSRQKAQDESKCTR